MAPLAGPSPTRANHKQRFGRVSCIKMTASFAAKVLQRRITTFDNFQKFVYRAENFNIIRRNNRNSAKLRAAEFLAIVAMTGHDLV
jgi:hypothetical protein